MYLHTGSQEFGACNPVSRLLHTPGLRVRRDAGRAGTFCYTEQQVAREEANEFVHFGTDVQELQWEMHVLLQVESPGKDGKELERVGK